ncbi:glycosyltransferase [Nostoc sp.]|uniref:glycosyltransferase n=1 Tax=Nostoc sp. TaxID=1180 RepID=UPI002FF9CA2C
MSISVRDFESQILNLINTGDLNSALDSIINLANTIVYGQEASIMTVSTVFGSITLDRVCQNIGNCAIGTQKSLLENKSNINKELIIYIASELYNSGGHTAVIEDLIKARPEKKHLILITDTFNLTDRPAVEDRFSPLNIQILWGPAGKALDKLNWLQHALSVNRAEQVFLLNHPHDAVAIAAVQPNLTPNLIFYHHAAHIFSLGVHLPYAQHIDFAPMSFYNCRNNLGLSNNIYLPLVVDNIPDQYLSYSSSSDKLRTCSSISENKLKGTPYLYSYIHEIRNIIATTGGVHIHIGDLSSDTLNTIKRGLREFEINSERFIHVPWVKSLGMAMYEYTVDIYLDTFPLGGGKSVIEVMASGTPIIVHNNYRSRQLCTTDITYPEAFRWQKVDELYNYLSTLNSEILSAESFYSRRHYERNYTPKVLREGLIKLEQGESTTLPPELKHYDLDDLQSFFDRFFAIKNILNTTNEHQLVQASIELSEKKYEIKRNLDFLRFKACNLDFKPVFSIIFPVFNTPEPYLKPAIESVLNQIYPYWELCIADDASTQPHIRKILEEYSQTDSRIKVIFRNENGHISRSSNSAIEIATGEFIALFDHDDLLTSDALYEVALLLNQHPDADMIYSDEDKVDDNNQFIYPTYKPDWCPDSFLSRMYTCHLGVYRRSLVNEIGGFRVGYEGSQDYDLVLRLTEKTDKIFHIPKILYHWRLHAGSTSASTTAKSYAYEAGFKALTDALSRRGEKGKILPDSNIPGHYHARYEIDCYKLVSIIIIARDFSYIFNQCLESIFAETLYPNYEVIVIDNGQIECDPEKIIGKWQAQQPNRFKYYSHNIPFSYSKLNNYAVTKAQGDYLFFLSSDIQVIQGDWLNVMVEQVQRDCIGAVGGFLIDYNNSIQHVGLTLGLGKIASHIYKGLTKIDEYETLANIALIKNVSVVTEDCLMCRRDAFESINGFDETLTILYNDVDLCLRLIGKGYKNIYLPHVKLTYKKISSWKVKLSAEERLKIEEIAVNLMQEKWGKILEYDPCFSPHLARSLNYNIQKENKIVRQHHSQEEVHKPLISICIPTYNGEIFIAEAINSVLCQTYPNIEIILSDDNSTDRTVEIAKSFNQELSFDFSIIEHGQYGLAQNWNFCISQAKGKYIKFLFQDDLLEPTAIEEMVNLAERDEEIGLVFSPRRLFTNTGDTVYDSNFLMHHEAKDVHKAWSKLKPIQSGQQLLLDPNILGSPINKIGEPSTVLIRKDVFEKVGLFNPEFCQLVDLEMWLRIMSQYKVGFIDQVLSHFRIHSEQQTRRNTALKDAILLDYQKLFQTIYSDTRYPEATRQQALYRYAVLSEQNSELQGLRKQIAEECLNIPDEKITDIYLGLLGTTYKMLVNSSIKYESLTDEEQIFANDILLRLSQGFDQPKAIQHLLAAMLYRRADQLPLQYDLSRIPSWLINDYLQFLFSSPVHFQELGDADNYYHYMQGWIDYLHKSILQNSDSRLWDEIANNFASIANFIPLYFNEHNLKDIYVKRGEIIEFLLKRKGYEVDYEFTNRPISRKKIRLGILAAHFLPGSETFAYLPVYEYISRDFEVILYSLNQTGHQLEQYCQSCANSFKLLPQDLAGQVNTIRNDDLDILFIATNVTAVTNQICFLSMHRLARIQVTSGGSVVTTGMRHIDYYISGTLTDPSATAEEQYREKLVKLEGTAHCFSYGNEQENVNIKVDRESLGISEEAVIFVSGANFFKIIPELINTWAKIISGVPNSVLVLLPFGPNWSNNYPKKDFVNHLIKVFSTHGIPAEQLIVLDPQPVPNREEVKEYFKIADVYLDSYPFAGTTSLVEPLQVNLPVIARRGSSFRSAMGAAMVQVLDIPNLVADSEESYIQLAIALGNNPKLRQEKSDQIKEKMQGNPSFLDSRSYSAKIGSLFQELLSKHLADTLSQNLQLGDINLIIFPDWLQPEESLGLALEQVIKTLVNHVNNEKITLIINTSNIATEDAEIFLSSIAMNLLLEEDLDINQGLEISLLENLSEIEWQALLPRINARLILEHEDQEALAKVPVKNLGCYELDNWINQFSTVD